MDRRRVTGPLPPRHQPKAAPVDARLANRRLVLQRLFLDGPLSRADMARSTGLTRPTVTEVVLGLMSEGLVEEIGRREDQGVGKPATLLGLDPDSRHILTFDLCDEEFLMGALVDLNGKVVVRSVERWRKRTGKTALSFLVGLAQEMAQSAARPILGVGVGSPGIVDTSGNVLEAARLKWTSVPLAATLSAALSLPVHVANDAAAATIGEYTYGETRGENLVLVRVGSGIGAGLLIGGRLFVGDHFAAGEIGHVIVDPDGAACRCGKRGCLETAITASLLGRRPDDADATTRATALASAGAGLGVALSTILAMLNIDEVVVSAPEELKGEAFLASALNAVRLRTLAATAGDPVVRYTTLGADDVLLGAAVLVLTSELGIA